MKYKIGNDSSIHMGTLVTGSFITIGDNVVINRNVYLDGRIGITCKNNISISPEVYIVSMEHDPNDPMFATRGGEVVIEDNVWIGVRAIILPGMHLGEGCVVGAGAVVTHDVEPYKIVAGIPARPIGDRSRKIEYRARYFPWFDSDIQRGQPRVRQQKAETRIARIFRRVKEEGAWSVLSKKIDSIRRSKELNNPHPISIEDWHAYYKNRKEINLLKEGLKKRVIYPKVSILILTYNNLAINEICLKSIYCNTTYTNFEVIVVDNASSDKTPEYLKAFSESHANIKIILNKENVGFAAGNNQAAKLASGEYLVFLNNDTIVTKGWIEGLMAHMQKDPNIGLIGPVTNSTGNEALINIDYKTPSQMNVFAARRAKKMAGTNFDIRMLAFFCVMTRKDQYQALGGLDERFLVGMFEDDDMAVRVHLIGQRVVCAEDVFIHHFQGAAFGKLNSEQYQKIFDENRKKYEEKWGRTWEPYTNRVIISN
jgi:GT2 family glycosyltransferase/acetyltransferase-like isoleucine patch superfamily enzyme